jgi:hypothetical protein
MRAQKDLDALETIVDKVGISETIRLLATVCSEKADHIRASYSDEELAELWEDAAEELDNIDFNGID